MFALMLAAMGSLISLTIVTILSAWALARKTGRMMDKITNEEGNSPVPDGPSGAVPSFGIGSLPGSA